MNDQNEIYTDPASGRAYRVDPATGRSVWVDTPAPQQAVWPSQGQPLTMPLRDEPEPRRRNGVKPWMAAGLCVVSLLIGYGAGAAGGDDAATATTTPKASTPAAAKKAAPAKPAGPATTITADGTYVVGEDIAAGTYKAPGADLCYWARLKDTSGAVEAIIANNINPGPQVVTIAKTDKAFETTGCGTWVKQ